MGSLHLVTALCCIILSNVAAAPYYWGGPDSSENTWAPTTESSNPLDDGLDSFLASVDWGRNATAMRRLGYSWIAGSWGRNSTAVPGFDESWIQRAPPTTRAGYWWDVTATGNWEATTASPTQAGTEDWWSRSETTTDWRENTAFTPRYNNWWFTPPYNRTLQPGSGWRNGTSYNERSTTPTTSSAHWWNTNPYEYYPHGRNTTPTSGSGNWWTRYTTSHWRQATTHAPSLGSSRSETVKLELPSSYLLDQDVHFALSLVPMLRARPLSSKLNTEIDILRYFKKIAHVHDDN